MATYVNLNVNQGLINKAKQAQGANRSSLANKQAARKAAQKAKEKSETGRKFGSDFRRRKVGASSDESFVIGQVIVYQRPVRTDFDQFLAERGANGGIELDVRQRRFLQPKDADVVVEDPGMLPATTNPYGLLGGNKKQSGFVETPIRIFPVGGDVAIVFCETSAEWVMYDPIYEERAGYQCAGVPPEDWPPGPYFRIIGYTPVPANVGSRSAFIVSPTTIREIPVPRGVRVFEFGTENGTGSNILSPNPSFKSYRYPDSQAGKEWLMMRDMGPTEILWTPAEYDNRSGLRDTLDQVLSGDPLGWDTEGGGAVTPDNPLRLFRFPGQTKENREEFTPPILHPEPRYQSEIQYPTDWMNYRPVPVPEEGVRGQVRWFLPFTASTTNYGFPSSIGAGGMAQQNNVVNVTIELSLGQRPVPPLADCGPGSASDPPTGTYTGRISIVDTPQIHTFWDGGEPEYCRAELLALGFTESDLIP